MYTKFKIPLLTLAAASIATMTVLTFPACQQEEDIAPPTISLLGDNPHYMDLNSDYIEPGFSVTDQEDGAISNDRVAVSSNVDKDVAGTYTVTYSVTDNAGNTGVTDRSVIVRNSAEFLAGEYNGAVNACQAPPNSVYDATIAISNTQNGKFTITNFGGFGNTVVLECSYDKSNNEITAVTGQSLGGTKVLESLNIASVTNHSSPVEFFINYNWRDGVVGDVCNATFSR